jgi:hypothetical protein
MGGSSEAAKQIAAEHIDTLLTWAEPPTDVAAKLASFRARAEAGGRRIRFWNSPARYRALNRCRRVGRRGPSRRSFFRAIRTLRKRTALPNLCFLCCRLSKKAGLRALRASFARGSRIIEIRQRYDEISRAGGDASEVFVAVETIF